MRLVIAALLLACATAAYASATVGTNVDTIQFVQYLDENTAIEEVRNGNLDMYYFSVPPDRIESAQLREGLKVYQSAGRTYSLLVNPAESEQFNPFSIREVRFALNYLVDRTLIVNELVGGYGVPMVSNYGPYNTEYLAILDELERFQFRYNPKLADQIISDALSDVGAHKKDGVWFYQESPIPVKVFIRSDDPVRKAIGEILAQELEERGFEITRNYGDLNKAFVVVYGSNPEDLKWNVYTEGWGGRSAFIRYDPIGLAQMYSPWFSNMPGFNDPSYWNYENPKLDEITQNIYTGNFTSAEQRNELIQQATVEAINESVRIFLIGNIDQYVVNQDTDGVINDFGAGVPTRFTAINARGVDDSLVIGVKQIYQGAWNPIRGLVDLYSMHIWNIINDPAVFKHPFTGDTIPIRAQWEVQTLGAGKKISVPDDAIIWDPVSQAWTGATKSEATSMVVFDLEFSNWHHGRPMDMYDVLHSLYFAIEWGTATDDNDKTVDTEYTPQATQKISTIIGVRQINDTRIEVYVDYWHFDKAEIADWATVWSVMPWEIYEAMQRAVLDGRVSFSQSSAVSKDVGWLSLLVPNDAQIIRQNLEDFGDDGFVPEPLKYFGLDSQYAQQRYDASIAWIEQKNHAVISNGPFYLDAYSPESRTITIASFDDPTYPFEKGHWSKFENVELPQIIGVQIPSIIKNDGTGITIQTNNTSDLQYFLSNSAGVIASGSIKMNGDQATIQMPDDIIPQDTNNIKIFAISESVQRPDFYSSSFIVSDYIPDAKTPQSTFDDAKAAADYTYPAAISAVIAAIIIIAYIKRSRG